MAAFHCCVPLCNNDSRYDRNKELSFFKFPTDKSEKKQWIIRIRRDVGKHFQITNATRVCSAHFLTSDFDRKLSGMRRRKPGAVPSIFSWTKDTPKRLSPQKRPCRKNQTCTITSEVGQSDSGDVTWTSDDMDSQDLASMQHIPPASTDHDYGTQPRSESDKLDAALKEIERLNQRVEELNGKLFFLERFSSDASLINFYTGFKDYNTLKGVFVALQPSTENMIRWTQIRRRAQKMNIKVLRDESLSLVDQFFMFMCRVRQGFNEQDLAVRFCISQASVSRILITWTNYLYFMLGSLPIWQSRTAIDANMPDCFKSTYPKTRVILDCTEIKVQTPSSKVLNSETYSSYKSHTTFKGLIGISPCGMVNFVSSLYTGCISDKEITSKSGILELLEEGDQVMADKGFLIQDLLAKKRASLVIPPFLGQKGKFSENEVKLTHEITRLRIHIERAIRRIKEYHIFDGVLPLSVASSVNQIWTVCSILTTFRGPLFK